MDYSLLVEAVQTGDQKTINRLCNEATVILRKYLVANMDASTDDAEDAVQRMFEYVIQKIRDDEITNPAGLLAYMLAGVRHAYFKLQRDLDIEELEELIEEPPTHALQMSSLVNEERQQILKKCLETLKGQYRALITFLFNFPDADSEEIAEHFNISVNNAWIRKHRVIKKLSDCAKLNS